MPDMNCETFRSEISEGKHPESTAAIEHLELCSECRAIAHAQEELARYLAAARETVPEPPESLDTSVVAAYRQRVEKTQAVSSRMRILRPLGWAAVGASVILFAALLIGQRKAVPPANVGSTPTPPTKKENLAAQPKSPEKLASKVAIRPRPVVRSAHAHRQKPRQRELASASVSATPNSGFQNLMFCDPLSCSGPMQVIRIQIPASAMDRVPAWRPASGMVRADVVVGSDGIARAIRIVR
jgi:hypothetical protein